LSERHNKTIEVFVTQENVQLAGESASGKKPPLYRVFKMQVNLAKNGTMKIDNWDL